MKLQQDTMNLSAICYAAALAVAGAHVLVIILWGDGYIAFLERTASPDGTISQPMPWLVMLTITLMGFALAPLAVRSALRYPAASRSPLFVAAWISFPGLVALYFAWPSGWRVENSPLEMATFVVSVLAAVVFVARAPSDARRLAYLMGAVWLLYAMEEISWGQQLFDWRSPTAFATKNFSSETNLHNFVNFDSPMANMIYVAIFGVGWLALGPLQSRLAALLPAGLGRELTVVAETLRPYKLDVALLIFFYAALTVGLVPGRREEYLEGLWTLWGLFAATALALRAQAARQSEAGRPEVGGPRTS